MAPRKAAERAFALGEADTFDYRLARDLGMTLAQVGEMGQDEFVRWRAFYVYEWAMQDLQMRSRAKRG